MFEDCTPAEIADALEVMERCPHNTGGLSMLDKATLAYGWKYPAVFPALQAFSAARYAHMRSYSSETGGYSDEAWRRAMHAAHVLAGALRPLGGARIERCKRQARGGACNFPLDDDGTCHNRDHTEAGDA